MGKILVIPQTTVRQLGIDSEWCDEPAIITALVDDKIGQWMQRDDAEHDERFRQLIPYVVAANSRDHILTYRRGSKGGEHRLHGFRSLGFGGHIEFFDEKNKSLSRYRKGLLREIEEELGLIDFTEVACGIICSSSSPVDRVHLGIVHLMPVSDDVVPKEDCLVDPLWMSRQEIWSRIDEFERWSQLVILELLANDMAKKAGKR